MKSTTRRILILLGLSPKYKGYDAIVEAVNLLNKDPHMKLMAVYDKVAKILDSTLPRVERNIRSAILVILERGDVDLIHKICGYVINTDGSMYSGDFLHCLTMYVQEVHNNA